MPERPSRRLRLLLVLALSAALLGSACGGDDETERYREDLTEAREKFDAVLKDAGQAGRSRDQFARDAARLQAGVREFRTELAALDPPSEAEDEQRDATAALEEFATAVGSTNAAVQSKDQDAVASEAARVKTTGAALDEALNKLAAAVD